MKNTFTRMSIRLMTLLVVIMMAAPQMNAQVTPLAKPNADVLFRQNDSQEQFARRNRHGIIHKPSNTNPSKDGEVSNDELAMKLARVLVGGMEITTGKILDAKILHGDQKQFLTFGQEKGGDIDSVIDPLFNNYLFGPDTKGILLTNGLAGNHIKTADDDDYRSAAYYGPGDSVLAAAFPGHTYNDAATLLITFKSKVSGILTFDYVYSTIEMNQNPEYNDPFALFVRDCGTDPDNLIETLPYTNVARMPEELYEYGVDTTVYISSMRQIFENDVPNPENYVSINPNPNPYCSPANYYEYYWFIDDVYYNGITKMFKTSFDAVKDHIYQIRLVVADMKDCGFDSQVFLRANSLCVVPYPPQIFGFKLDSVFYYEPDQTVISVGLKTNTQGAVYFMNKQCTEQSEFDDPENQLITPVDIDENFTGYAELPTTDGSYYAYLKTEAGDVSRPNPFWIAPKQSAELITITYDANGGKFADYDNKDTLMRSQIKYTFTKEPDFRPEYNGLDIFIRWCTDEEGTTPYKFGKRIEEDITLYAAYGGWDITYDGMGKPMYNSKSDSYVDEIVKKCNSLNYSFPVEPFYNNYTVEGWYLEKTYETKITDGEQVKTFGAHTLYAKWVKDPEYWKKLTYSVVGQGTADVTDYYNSSVHYVSGETKAVIDTYSSYIGNYAYYNVEATPAEHYHFSKFVITGNNEGTYTDNPKWFTPINKDVNIVVYFEGDPCQITATPISETLGTVDGGGEYHYGEEVTLTATPIHNQISFAGWALASDSKTIVSTENPLKFTATCDTAFIATFGTWTFSAEGNTLKATCDTHGEKKVVINADTFNYDGNEHEATVTTDEWTALGLKYSINYIGREQTEYEQSEDGPVEFGYYTARLIPSETTQDPIPTATTDFKILPQVLGVPANPAQGSVTIKNSNNEVISSGSFVEPYESVTLTATAFEHCFFKEWIIADNAKAGITENPTTTVMNASKRTVTAYFEGEKQKVTAYRNRPFGTVTIAEATEPSKADDQYKVEATFEYGTAVLLTAEPLSEEYTFMWWSPKNDTTVRLCESATYQITLLEDVEVMAVFVNEVQVNIEAVPSDGGQVKIKNNVTGQYLDEEQRKHIKFGTSVTIEAACSDDYAFSGWYDKDTNTLFSKKQVMTFDAKTLKLNLEARFTDQVIWVRVKKGN